MPPPSQQNSFCLSDSFECCCCEIRARGLFCRCVCIVQFPTKRKFMQSLYMLNEPLSSSLSPRRDYVRIRFMPFPLYSRSCCFSFLRRTCSCKGFADSVLIHSCFICKASHPTKCVVLYHRRARSAKLKLRMHRTSMGMQRDEPSCLQFLPAGAYRAWVVYAPRISPRAPVSLSR